MAGLRKTLLKAKDRPELHLVAGEIDAIDPPLGQPDHRHRAALTWHIGQQRRVPREPHDRRVDCVVTEKKILRI